MENKAVANEDTVRIEETERCTFLVEESMEYDNMISAE